MYRFARWCGPPGRVVTKRNVAMIWMSRIRFRVLAFTVGLAFTAIALISWAALPVLPVIGVAVAAAAVGVNQMTSRLKQPVCHGCGESLGDAPSGQYGVVCPHCGSLTQVGPLDDTAIVFDDEADGQPPAA